MYVPQIPDILPYAVPFFFVTVILESLITRHERPKKYEIRDTAASITMGIGSLVSGILNKIFVVWLLFGAYENFRIFTIPFTWWAWVLILFADDICYYFLHRYGHEVRFLWASHIVHHSSQKYNLSTALRQTWTGNFFTIVFYLVLPFFGFHPLMILTQMSVSLIYQYWIHTETIYKLPVWFEAVMNTPSHHRVHHGSNPLYLDRNYAGIFIIWDRIFNTFQSELPSEKAVYGLTTNIKNYNPIYIAFHEWIALFKDVFTSKTSFLNRLKYLVKPPGWRHDGTGVTSEDMRKQWLESKRVKPLN